MAERLYFAYGSNINLDQMAQRCPAAQVVGPAVLKDYELLFRGNHYDYGVATIEPMSGSQVHGLMWKLTQECEESLDVYEGYPNLYGKEMVTVRTHDGQEIPVMAYVMNDEWQLMPTIPSRQYYECILDGYRQNGLPVKALEAALQNVRDEVRQDRFLERVQYLDMFNRKPYNRKKDENHER